MATPLSATFAVLLSRIVPAAAADDPLLSWNVNASEPVSGDGQIYSLAINHQPWDPRMPPPYLFASIELVEQPALRVISTVIDCPPDQPAIGDAVQVAFEPCGSWFLPVFRLAIR